MIDQIKAIIAKQLRISADDITEDSKIIEDLGADSLDLVEMLLAIEDNLGIVVDDETAAGLKTIGDVADFVESVSQ